MYLETFYQPVHVDRYISNLPTAVGFAACCRAETAAGRIGRDYNGDVHRGNIYGRGIRVGVLLFLPLGFLLLLAAAISAS